jgi:hypothetical protein
LPGFRAKQREYRALRRKQSVGERVVPRGTADHEPPTALDHRKPNQARQREQLYPTHVRSSSTDGSPPGTEDASAPSSDCE